MLGWYLRRAVPWDALLCCTAGGAGVAVVLVRWPENAPLLLPAMLGCCAAAAGFVFDEPVAGVASVTPRGSRWAGSVRLLAALVPFVVWAVLVTIRPGDLPLDQPLWWLVGAAAVALTAGLAARSTRRSTPEPGSALAAAVVVSTLSPVVITMFLDLDSIYPIGAVPAWVRVFWLVLATAGLVLCSSALRPDVRRR